MIYLYINISFFVEFEYFLLIESIYLLLFLDYNLLFLHCILFCTTDLTSFNFELLFRIVFFKLFLSVKGLEHLNIQSVREIRAILSTVVGDD